MDRRPDLCVIPGPEFSNWYIVCGAYLGTRVLASIVVERLLQRLPYPALAVQPDGTQLEKNTLGKHSRVVGIVVILVDYWTSLHKYLILDMVVSC